MKINILVVTVTYILGIILGLYIQNICIALLLCLVCLVLIIVINKLLNNKNEKLNVIFFCSITVIIFTFSLVRTKNFQNRFKYLYNEIDKANITGTVLNLESERNYYNTYRIKVKNVNGMTRYKNTLILAKITKKVDEIKIGDTVTASGNFLEVDTQRNYHGFDYEKYLNSNGIYAVIKVSNIKKLDNQSFNLYKLKNMIITNVNKVLQGKDRGMCLALILGYKSGITEEVRSSFEDAGLMHVLAISGMHVAYIFLILNYVFKRINRKYSKVLIVLVLLFYIRITGDNICVIRACVMEIICVMASILYRKSNTISNLSFSALLTLVLNPLALINISFIFSYTGVLGIILLEPIVCKWWDLIEIKLYGRILNSISNTTSHINTLLYNVYLYVKKIIIITISSNISLLPLSMLFYNSITPLAILSGLIIAPFLPIVIILGMVQVLTSSISLHLGKIISCISILVLKTFNHVVALLGNIGISKLYVKSPPLSGIFLYYIFILIIIFYIKNNNLKIYAIIKKYFKYIFSKSITVIIIFVFIFTSIIVKTIPEKLYIYFIDVGQGDSSLIVTPFHKSILIDGGGSEEYDIGKNTVIPYLLARGIKKLDYIFISHFDTDHVGRTVICYEEITGRTCNNM